MLSNAVIPTLTATFRDLAFSCMGIFILADAAAYTSSGTPLLSRPNSRKSSFWNIKSVIS